MPRPISEKVHDIRWWGEHLGHALLGGLAALSVAWVFLLAPQPSVLVVAQFVAGAAGAIRELVQNWNDPPESNDLPDSHFDAIGFQVGGLIVTIPMAVFA